MNTTNLDRSRMLEVTLVAVVAVMMFGCGDGGNERLEARISELEEALG